MAAPKFRNEDEAAQYYLSTLRDGTPVEKIVARDGLAAIFSRRGLFEEAAELYELNIRAGERSPELFEHLSDVYRQLGDDESAEAALAEARRPRQDAPAASLPAAPTNGEPGPVNGAGPARQDRRPAAPPDSGYQPRLIPMSGQAAAGRAAAPAEPAVSASIGAGARAGEPAAVGPETPAVARDLATDGLMEVPGRPPAVTAPLPAPPPAALARRSGRSLSVPTPLLVTGIVLVLIVLPVTLLALLVVNPIALYLEGRAAGPTVDAQAGEPPELKVAPGASSAWYIMTGHSVSGLWATPGLDLMLDQDVEGAGRTFAVTGARPQSWGETITIVERRGQGRANQPTVVPATFDAPRSLPPVGTVLTGRIAGQVTAPRLSESSQFTTTTENVDLPVRLVVVSSTDLWLDRLVNAFKMYFDDDRWLLVTIGALLAWCVLAGGTALVFRVGQR
jgi:hypothetical protein